MSPAALLLRRVHAEWPVRCWLCRLTSWDDLAILWLWPVVLPCRGTLHVSLRSAVAHSTFHSVVQVWIAMGLSAFYLCYGLSASYCRAQCE